MEQYKRKLTQAMEDLRYLEGKIKETYPWKPGYKSLIMKRDLKQQSINFFIRKINEDGNDE